MITGRRYADRMPAHPLTAARRALVLATLSRLAGGLVTVIAEQHVGHEWAPVTRWILDRDLPGFGSTVVIKTRRVDDSGHGGPAYLRREAAGLRTASPTGVAAALIDFDDRAGVAIQSDLGSWPTLQDLLLDRDHPDAASRAAAGMVALAIAAARLHAGTLGRGHDHQRELDRFAADVVTGGAYAFGPERWDQIEADCAALGLPPAHPARDEVRALLGRTVQAEPYGALVHLDLNPTNVLITDAGARLVDFEGCRYGHLGIDACFLSYPFPHHSAPWSVLPDPVVGAAELAYRTALADGGADQVLARYDRGLADGAAITLIGRLSRLPLVASTDQSAQDARRRRGQILHQIGVFARLAEPAGGLGAFTDWLQRLAGAMVARWPDAADPAPPLFPAFE